MMIFSCGENWAAYKKRIGEWHDFFAIFPCTIDVVDGKELCVWLQTIERRGEYRGYPIHVWSWEYRLKK